MALRPPSSWLRRAGQFTMFAAAAFALPPMAVESGGLGALDIALIVGFVILSLGIHEAAHGWVALKCGDPTARDLGRITLNPIPHIDPIMTILVPGLLAMAGQPPFGGAKPVPVDYHRLNNPPRDMALVALAGPVSNFLLAIVFAIAVKLLLRSDDYGSNTRVMLVLQYAMYANIVLAAFNLLPIPPLDGSRVVAWLLPASMRPGYQMLDRFGILIVFLLMQFAPPIRRAVSDMVGGILWVIDNLTLAI